MKTRSLSAKLAIIIALTLALILAVLVWMGWFEGQAITRLPPRSEPAPTPVPAASTPLATPKLEAPAARASAAEAPAAVTSTTATLVVTCRAKETGAPLANTEVMLAPLDLKNGAVSQPSGTHGQLGDDLTTAVEGRVEFEIPAGVPAKLYMNSRQPGLTESASREIAALASGERRDLVIDLRTRDDGRFFIRVLARETKLACAGALVTIAGDKSLSGHCDADGRFDVACASWQMKHLRVHVDGFSDAIVGTRVGHDRPDTALEILLERSATLIGVLEGQPDTTGKALVFEVLTESYRFQQHLELAGNDMDIGDTSWRQKFDGSGRALVTDVLAGAPLRVTVTKGRSIVLALTKEISLEPGETREIPLRIDEGCRITGTVRDGEHQPVAGQELWLSRNGRNAQRYFTISDGAEAVAKTKTDVNGRFTLEHVQAGSWRLGPAYEYIRDDPDGSKMARTVAPLATQVELAEGIAEQTVDLVVYRGLTIRGKVLDPDGAPTAKASVDGWCEPLFVFTSPRADGQFILGPLVPGMCKLNAEAQGDNALSERIEVQAGATNVVLQLRRGASIAGRVVDAISGEACSARMVQSYPSDPLGRLSLPETKPDGSFKIEGLLPGRVALAAHTADGRTGSLPDLQLASGAKLENLVIQVARGASVRVRYDGKASAGNASVLHDGIVVEMDGVESGTTKTLHAPAGAVQVKFQIYALKKTFERELTLAVGEERELLFKDDD